MLATKLVAAAILVLFLLSPAFGQTFDSFLGVAGVPCSAPAPGRISTSIAAPIAAGTQTVTPASMAGIAVGKWLDIDPDTAPNSRPPLVSNDPLRTGDGHTTVFKASLAHASLVANSLVVFVAGVSVAADLNGRVGSYSGTLDGLVRWSDGFIYVNFAAAPANGSAITAAYSYLPAEFVKVTAVTPSTFTATFLNAHAAGAAVYPGYFRLGKISGNRWVWCDPLNNAFENLGVWSLDGSDGHVNPQGNMLAAVAAAKYGDYDVTYSQAQIARLRGLGFNTTAPFSTSWYDGDGRVDSRWPTPAPFLPPLRQPFFGEYDVAYYAGWNAFNYTVDPPKLLPANTSFYTNYYSPLVDWDDSRYSAQIAATLTGNVSESPFVLGIMEDETDYLFGFSAGGDFPTYDYSGSAVFPSNNNARNLAWYVLVTPPHMAAGQVTGNSQVYNIAYTDTVNYLKQQLAASLSAEYGGNIAALNAAWGSNYSSFGTSGAAQGPTTLLTGDGITAIFNPVLSNTKVDAYSLGFSVAGYAIGGDFGDSTHGAAGVGVCGTVNSPWLASTSWLLGQRILAANTIFVVTSAGISGASVPAWNTTAGSVTADAGVQWTALIPAMTSCTVNYSTGALSIKFASAPPSPISVVVLYWTNGWGRGPGLLDEDGRNTTWLGVSGHGLTADVVPSFASIVGQSSAFRTDMQSQVAALASGFFGTWRAQQQALDPDLVLMTPYALGSHGEPANCGIYRAAAPYVDVISAALDWQPLPWTMQLSSSTSSAPGLSRRAYQEACSGDLPVIFWVGASANADSGVHDCTVAVCGAAALLAPDGESNFSSQAARAVWLQSLAEAAFDRPSLWGSYNAVGIDWWQFDDQLNQQMSWSLVSTNDNLYDGVQASTAGGNDPAVFRFSFSGGTPNPARTPEDRDYGDFISGVKAANAIVIAALTGTALPSRIPVAGSSQSGTAVSHR